jgi:hypothetical protein
MYAILSIRSKANAVNHYILRRNSMITIKSNTVLVEVNTNEVKLEVGVSSKGNVGALVVSNLEGPSCTTVFEFTNIDTVEDVIHHLTELRNDMLLKHK